MTDYRTTADLQEALEKHGVDASEHQLRRWAEAGLLPQRSSAVIRRGPGVGSEKPWPPDTLRAAILLADDSRPGRVVSVDALKRLLGAGYSVPPEQLRRVLKGELDVWGPAYGVGQQAAAWDDSALEQAQKQQEEAVRWLAEEIGPKPGERFLERHRQLYLRLGQERLDWILAELLAPYLDGDEPLLSPPVLALLMLLESSRAALTAAFRDRPGKRPARPGPPFRRLPDMAAEQVKEAGVGNT